MKKLLCLALAAVLLLCFASCASKDYYNFNYDEYVTLAEYKGIEVSIADLDKEVQSATTTILNSNKTKVDVTDRAAAKDDIATVSYTAKVDGVEIEKMAAAGKTVTIGSDKMEYDGFEDALVGMKPGESKDATLTLDEDFAVDGLDAQLGGKEAVFSISMTTLQVENVPTDLTAEMVADYTDNEYTEVDKYLAYVRDEAKQNAAWSTLISKCDVIKYPKKEAEQYYNMMINQMKATAQQYSMTLENYVLAMGYTDLETYLTKYVTPAAANQAIAHIVVLELYAKENLSYTEQEYNDVAGDYAENYDKADAAAFIEEYGDSDIIFALQQRAVYRFIADNAVEVKGTDDTTAAESAEDTTAADSADPATSGTVEEDTTLESAEN